MQLVFASNNMGKLREFQAAFPKNIQLIPQTKFNTPGVEETGLSFIENAIIKARNVSRYANLPALADDSGIVVDALNGEPGIYSARYAGENATDENNRQKLLKALTSIPEGKRSARFVCALALLHHAKDPCPIICQAFWEGRILLKEQGEKGFGYDPIFYVPSHDCSVAELPLEIKNQISHRGAAISKLFHLIL